MNMPLGFARLAIASAIFAIAGCSKSGENSATPPPPPQLYSINLSPAFKIGQKFSLVSDLSEKSQSHTVINLPGIALPQNDDRSEGLAADLEGEAEVLGVFPNGGMQKLSLTVKAIKVSKNGKAIPGLPATGAKIIAERTGDKIAISVNDQAADADVTSALNELIALDDDKFTLQDLCGSKVPVALGATWPVNSADVEDSLKSSLGGEFTGAKGTMKLESIKGVGADQIATVSGGFAIDSYKPTLPAVMTIDSGVITSSFSCLIPATTGKSALKIMKSMNMKTQAHGSPNGATVKLELTGQQIRNTVMTFQ